MDLSSTLFNKRVKFVPVNDKTTKMARPEAMAQFGFVLKRIIHTMAQYRHHGLRIKFTKLDIQDGFWRMAVSYEDAWNFCYLLPSLQTTTDIDDTEIVVPNTLKMVWYESPPLFLLGIGNS